MAATRLTPASTVFLVPPRRLNRHRLEQFAFLDAVLLFHPADLKHFAAEADENDSGDVRIARIAPLRSLQNVEALALAGHAAAGAVDQRDHSIDIRVVFQNSRLFDFARDQAGDGRGAVHARQDGDVVPDANFSVGATKALKGRALLERKHDFRLRRFAKTVVARKVVHHDIVLMDPIARRDHARRKTDDLAEFQDRRANLDAARRDLVSFGNALPRRRRVRGNLARADFIDRDHDVVVGTEADRPRAGRNGLHNFLHRLGKSVCPGS